MNSSSRGVRKTKANSKPNLKKRRYHNYKSRINPNFSQLPDNILLKIAQELPQERIQPVRGYIRTQYVSGQGSNNSTNPNPNQLHYILDNEHLLTERTRRQFQELRNLRGANIARTRKNGAAVFFLQKLYKRPWRSEPTHNGNLVSHPNQITLRQLKLPASLLGLGSNPAHMYVATNSCSWWGLYYSW